VEVFGYDDDAKVFDRPGLAGLLKHEAFHSMIGVIGLRVDLVVASPGIPEDSATIKELRHQKTRVIDELELGYEIVGKKIIAVTGTNGKSTTTTLMGEIMRADGRNVFYGGNLVPGRPLSSSLLEAPKDYYVLEVSSFQLERCESFAPKLGVLLNVTPDHLDRHKTMERYLALKLSLFRNQEADDFAVINLDDELIVRNRARIPATVATFAFSNPQADARVNEGVMTFRDEPIMPVADLRLPGRHNIANALAAIAATRTLGVKVESIVQVLSAFRGLEHRLELARELGGVKYINNSMCTNPAAAIQSLESFTAPVILITGGRDKHLPMDDYLKAVAERAKAVMLVGENRQRLYAMLRRLNAKSLQAVDNLDTAVLRARELSQPGDVVLFSPGFASFDAYKDFQDRGSAFREAVAKLVP
jgi:UDP-N-acetylmuramoylalanine--D-glutamate ligase